MAYKVKRFKRTGIGIGGAPRRGKPKTDEERLRQHFGADWRKHSAKELPKRGAGLKRKRKGIIKALRG